MNIYIHKKHFLFVEPKISIEITVKDVVLRDYGILIISRNDEFLNLPTKKLIPSSVFFQVDTHNEEAVLHLMTQLMQRFRIEGVIVGNEFYSSLASRIARYLKKPLLNFYINNNID